MRSVLCGIARRLLARVALIHKSHFNGGMHRHMHFAALAFLRAGVTGADCRFNCPRSSTNDRWSKGLKTDPLHSIDVSGE
jgi:hypothetical protein